VPELPASWQKLSALSGIIAAVLVPLAVAVAGHAVALAGQDVSRALKEREMQVRFVELSVDILRESPMYNEADSIRGWATGVLSKYSGVPMNRGAQKALQSTTLPEARLPERGRDSDSASVEPPPELVEALRKMQTYTGFQSDSATIAEARRMLLAVGLNRLSESAEAVSAMVGTWQITLWPGSYGKARAFGVRYQPMPNGSWDAQSTYQEILMPTRN
jgi:hypothetical protein